MKETDEGLLLILNYQQKKTNSGGWRSSIRLLFHSRPLNYGGCRYISLFLNEMSLFTTQSLTFNIFWSFTSPAACEPMEWRFSAGENSSSVLFLRLHQVFMQRVRLLPPPVALRHTHAATNQPTGESSSCRRHFLLALRWVLALRRVPALPRWHKAPTGF